MNLNQPPTLDDHPKNEILLDILHAKYKTELGATGTNMVLIRPDPNNPTGPWISAEDPMSHMNRVSTYYTQTIPGVAQAERASLRQARYQNGDTALQQVDTKEQNIQNIVYNLYNSAISHGDEQWYKYLHDTNNSVRFNINRWKSATSRTDFYAALPLPAFNVTNLFSRINWRNNVAHWVADAPNGYNHNAEQFNNKPLHQHNGQSLPLFSKIDLSKKTGLDFEAIEPEQITAPLSYEDVKKAKEKYDEIKKLHTQLLQITIIPPNASFTTAQQAQREQLSKTMDAKTEALFKKYGSVQNLQNLIEHFSPKRELTNLPKSIVDKIVKLPASRRIAIETIQTANPTVAQMEAYINANQNVPDKDILNEIITHMRAGHNPVDDAHYELSKKEEKMSWGQRYKRRMGRAAAATFHEVAAGRSGIGIQLKQAVAGLFDKEIYEVKQQRSTIKETFKGSVNARKDNDRANVHTNIIAPSGGIDAILAWGNDNPNTGQKDLPTIDQLSDVELFKEQRQRDEEKKHKKHRDKRWEGYHKGQRSSWLNRWLDNPNFNPAHDSYYGSKEHGHAISSRAENYDVDNGVSVDYQTHQILNHFLGDANHNPALMAMLWSMRELDYMNGANLGNIDLNDAQDLQKELKKSVNTENALAGLNQDIRKLDETLINPNSHGDIWKTFLQRNLPADAGQVLRAQSEIRELIERIRCAQKKLQDEADIAKKKWQEMATELQTMFNENEFETTATISNQSLNMFQTAIQGNSQEEKYRTKLTFRTIKHSQMNAIQLGRMSNQEFGILQGSGNWYDSLALNAVKGNLNETLFVEVRVHLHDADGRLLDQRFNPPRPINKTTRPADYEHEQSHDGGRVVGYIDTRTGSLVGLD